ncbi:MAG: hypothetical protein Q8916_08505 [Bacteroidota bacterium]|nr:hypothetical protein [Bacteroidota bacterium]MDP4230426.1 hypothetical protein [Bacteroidota bacterium]MDP4236432.1 hypothetical protein [Bacteroidota bacterium]
MKLRLSFFALGATLLLAGTLLTGCTQTTTPTTTDNRSKVVSSSTDTYIDVTGLSDNQLYEFTVAGSSSSTALTGFSSYQNGTIRVFWTRGAGDASADTVYYRTATGSTASAGYHLWATAIRSTSTLRVFETADPTDPSGLILGPTAKTTSISGSDKMSIDLVLATVNNTPPGYPFLSLQAADVIGGVGVGAKADTVSNPRQVLGGLAMDQSLTGTFTKGTFPRYVDLVSNIHDISYVFDVRTYDDHAARVEIVPQAALTTVNGTAGHYLWGDTGGTPSYRYIDVNVTYQPTVGWNYDGRPGITRRATSVAPR